MKTIAVVDDDKTNLRMTEEVLKGHYFVAPINSGVNLIKYLEKHTPDLILLDISMPEMDGFQTFRELKKLPRAAEIPVIFLTSRSDPDSEAEGLDMGAVDFIAKPIVKKTTLSRIQTHIELASYQKDLKGIIREKTRQVEKVQDALVISLAELVECRDEQTGGHTRRTAHYMKLLVEALRGRGLFDDIIDDEYIHQMCRCAILHDIGKVGIDDSTLLKSDRLDEREMEYMRKHTVIGKNALDKAIGIIGGDPFLERASELAYCHHEKWDGTGYPQGLKENEIPLGARILAIVDVYDALTSSRSYKQPISHERSVEMILSDRGKAFDPLITDVFGEISEDFRLALEQFNVK